MPRPNEHYPPSQRKREYAREYYQANKKQILEKAKLKRRLALGLGVYAFQDDPPELNPSGSLNVTNCSELSYSNPN